MCGALGGFGRWDWSTPCPWGPFGIPNENLVFASETFAWNPDFRRIFLFFKILQKTAAQRRNRPKHAEEADEQPPITMCCQQECAAHAAHFRRTSAHFRALARSQVRALPRTSAHFRAHTHTCRQRVRTCPHTSAHFRALPRVPCAFVVCWADRPADAHACRDRKCVGTDSGRLSWSIFLNFRCKCFDSCVSPKKSRCNEKQGKTIKAKQEPTKSRATSEAELRSMSVPVFRSCCSATCHVSCPCQLVLCLLCACD